MSKVIVYTGKNCSYCTSAKQLLEQRGINYQEIDMSTLDQKTLQEVLDKSKMRTVPQIFNGDELIGGYTELAAQDKVDQLKSLL